MKLRPFARLTVNCPYSPLDAYNRVLSVVEPRRTLVTQFLDGYKHNPCARRPYIGYVSRSEFAVRENSLWYADAWHGSLALVSGRIEGSRSGSAIKLTIGPRRTLMAGAALGLLAAALTLYLTVINSTIFYFFIVSGLLFPAAMILLVVKHCKDVEKERAFFLKLFQGQPVRHTFHYGAPYV